ncbi:hypothetical protein VTK73DRAFT_769 [Phialemonium thermophilum]|uniref:Uncharacterized protein n=1 Tax=Phialemonium thermophilum TaxID=223376 RepID=A0ABR3XDI1_9PEZI
MSSPPLPLQSKVAITAIRGLIVGTSCSLLLIAEDRRRRINNARSAIYNGQRIKAARNYRSGGAELALALEEEVLLDAESLHLTPQTVAKSARNQGNDWVRPPRLGLHGGAPGASDTERSIIPDLGVVDHASVGAGTLQTSNSEGKDLANLHVRASPLRQNERAVRLRELSKTRGARAQASAVKTFAFPKLEDVIGVIEDAVGTKDPRRLAVAVQLVPQAIRARQGSESVDNSLRQAATHLCLACLDLGRADEARQLLRSIVDQGPLSEEAYMELKPFDLIEQLLDELEKLSSCETNVKREKLGLAVALFLPTLTQKPRAGNDRALDIARRLLAYSFAAGQLGHVEQLYWRSLAYTENRNDYQHTAWFISNLHQHGEYRPAIKIFLLNYAKLTPDADSFYAAGDVVVDSVTASFSYKVEQVLKALLQLQSRTSLPLKTVWVIKLLEAHWKRHADFSKTECLFQTLSSGLDSAVRHPDGVYRMMMEIAFDAGRPELAESYFSQLVRQRPELASNVRLLALLAEHKAKLGDWDGVWKTFSDMNLESEEDRIACGRAFVPILKHYSRIHTITETENFIKPFVDELGVPITSYTMTFMANQYGSVRDLESLLQWLKYCADSGVEVNATMSNTILTNCRLRWKFAFKDLRHIFLKLRALSPGLVDQKTEYTLRNAAVSATHGRAAVRRILSLGGHANKRAFQGKSAAVSDILQEMKEQLSFGRPGQCLRIYKRAISIGMPFSSRALCIAVQASLKAYPDDVSNAYRLVQRAQQDGADVSSAAVPIMVEQMRIIKRTTAKKSWVHAINKAVEQLQAKQIKVSDFVLNLAGMTLLNGGYFAEAAEFALKAAEVSSSSQPCYNMHNFTILSSACAELGDVDGLRWAIDKAKSSEYWTGHHCLRTLKRIRRRMVSSLQMREAPSVAAAREVIVAAIADALEARRKLREEREILGREVMEIMKKAAVDEAAHGSAAGHIEPFGLDGGFKAETGSDSGVDVLSDPGLDRSDRDGLDGPSSAEDMSSDEDFTALDYRRPPMRPPPQKHLGVRRKHSVGALSG